MSEQLDGRVLGARVFRRIAVALEELAQRVELGEFDSLPKEAMSEAVQVAMRAGSEPVWEAELAGEWVSEPEAGSDG